MACPPPPKTPLTPVQQTQDLSSVLETIVSPVMFRETKLSWLVIKDSRPMALELTVGGDTEEDEEVAHVVNVPSKQRATVGKGKEHDLGQQSDRENLLTNHRCLQPYEFFFQHRLFKLTMMMGPTPISTMSSILTVMSKTLTTGLVMTR